MQSSPVEQRSRRQIPFAVLGIAGIAAMTLSSFLMMDLFRAEPLATASVGIVQNARQMEPLRRTNLWTFLGLAPSQVDRIEVITSHGRFVVSGVTGFPEGSAVEVRDTPFDGRQLCSMSPPSCASLWTDATPVVASTTPEAGQAAFMSVFMKFVFPPVLFLMVAAAAFRFVVR